MPNQYSTEVMRVALAAKCSERTVRRYLDDPTCVNQNNRERIAEALREQSGTNPSKLKKGKASKRG
jgi:DNA-binding LacI/PurR family transcriptional regulator